MKFFKNMFHKNLNYNCNMYHYLETKDTLIKHLEGKIIFNMYNWKKNFGTTFLKIFLQFSMSCQLYV